VPYYYKRVTKKESTHSTTPILALYEKATQGLLDVLVQTAENKT
jgi:hypothetical protein